MSIPVGCYGQTWRQGVLSDHLHQAEQAGAKVRLLASGTHVVVLPGGVVEPVLCSEIVEVWTEDGVIDGRCGIPVMRGAGHFCCEGHQWVETMVAEREVSA